MFTDFFKSGSALTNDIIVLGTLFILFATYALYFGKSRIVSLILAFYPAVFLYEQFPYASKLMFLHGDQPILLNKILVFLIFLIPLNIIIGRFVFAESGYGGSFHFLRVAGLALAGTMLALVFTYSVIDLSLFYSFSPTISALFVSAYIFWWMLAPLVLMFFL